MGRGLDDGELSEGQKRVIAAAMEVFAERGFAAASTSEIAKRAGVAEGTVFRHFKTKKDLLIGAVSPLLVRLMAPVITHKISEILSTPHASFEEFFRVIVANRMEVVANNTTMMRILVQEIPFQPELRARLRTEVIEPLLPRITGLIQGFQARGEIDPTLPPHVVIRVVGASIGAYLLLRTFLAPEVAWDDPAEIDATARILVRGLVPDDAPSRRAAAAKGAGAKPEPAETEPAAPTAKPTSKKAR